MKKNNLILEDSFSTHQKIHLYAISSPVVAILLELLQVDLSWTSPFFVFFFVNLLLLVTVFAFSKKGFSKSNGKLYKAKFFWGRVLYRSSINILDRPVVSILKFKRSRKYAFFSAAKPDLASSFNSFEVYILNERHTKRDLLMRLKSKEKAEKAIEFLCSEQLLKHEVYSPNFGYARVPRR